MVLYKARNGLWSYSNANIVISDESQLKFNQLNVDYGFHSVIRAENRIPDKTSFTFEIQVTKADELGVTGIGIGLSSDLHQNNGELDMFPGMNRKSIGYWSLGDNGTISKAMGIGPHEIDTPMFKMERTMAFGENDVIGCHVVRRNIQGIEYTACQFSSNGERRGFSHLLGSNQLYPTIGVISPGTEMKVNLGAEQCQYPLGTL